MNNEYQLVPSTVSQREMYVFSQMKGTGITFNIVLAMVLTGEINRQKWETVFHTIIERHEALRTSFKLIKNDVYQKIYKNFQFNILWHKTPESQMNINEIITNLLKPFDVEVQPLFRVHMVEMSSNRHLLVIEAFHGVFDGHSISILTDEIIKIYKGETLPACSAQYRDFALWQKQFLESEEYNKQLQYWIKHLNDYTSGSAIPYDFKKTWVRSFQGDALFFEVDASLTRKVKNVISQRGITLFNFLLSIYYLLIYRLSGCNDILIACPVMGRDKAEFYNIIGMFVNTIVLRNEINDNISFFNFIDRVSLTTQNAMKNQNVVFESIVKQLGIRSGLNINPLCEHIFTCREVNLSEDTLGDISIHFYDRINWKISRTDMTIDALCSSNKISFKVEYNDRLYTKSTVQRIADLYLSILNTVSDGKNRLIGMIK